MSHPTTHPFFKIVTILFFVSPIVSPAHLVAQSAEEFRPRVVIKRPFPAIKDVENQPAHEASRVLKDDELVLGIVIGGKARAYAINMLNGPSREIINDTLGQKSIAATW